MAVHCVLVHEAAMSVENVQVQKVLLAIPTGQSHGSEISTPMS